MTQGKNKTPQAQAPTLGTLLATALGIAYGAWAVIVWGSGFSEEHLPSSPQAKAQSCQVEWGNSPKAEAKVQSPGQPTHHQVETHN